MFYTKLNQSFDFCNKFIIKIHNDDFGDNFVTKFLYTKSILLLMKIKATIVPIILFLGNLAGRFA